MKSFVRHLALAVLLAPAVAFAAPPKSGTWELAYSPIPTTEQVLCLVKIDVKDGGAVTGEMVAVSPAMRELEITGVSYAADVLRVQIKLNGADYSFEGKVNQADGKVSGSFGDDKRLWIARMAPSDKSEIARADATKRVTLPEPMTKAQQLTLRPATLRRQAAQAKGQEDKEKLTKQAADAEKEAKTEVPKLYMEVLEKHAESPAAIDAAMRLITEAAKSRADADQVKRWAGLAAKAGAVYGPRYQRETTIKVAEALAAQKAFATLAADYASRAENTLGANASPDIVVRVLDALAIAQRNAGHPDVAATESRLEKFQLALDQEYKTKFPFTPAKFDGRKEKSDRVVVMELFTGAQCPPCVAADLAFDGLDKTYKSNDVVFLQHHMHIPGPDPMTNSITEGRWAYYRKVHGDMALRGVPSSVFNGKPQAGGGGGIPQAQAKYNAYREIIDKLLEEAPEAKVALRARREGNTINMSATVSNLKEPGEDMRLRFVLAEEEIRFVGSNNIRFHHMVVRDMPGGADGFKLTDKTGEHSAAVNLDELKKSLVKYLDDFVEKRGPFPKPQRPLALKNLKVIALVQNDKTGEILQAAQADLGEERVSK